MITHIFKTDAEASRALIGRILQLAAECPPSRKINIALSGGSTPALMFRLWADEFDEQTPWERIRFFWVDERCVPPTDSQSNYGMTRDNLLSRVDIPQGNVVRIMGENPPEDEARRYEEVVRNLLPEEGGFPAFDIVLLGAGDDGHTSSIFPGQEELLTSHEAYAVGIHPTSGQQRVALTGMPIIHARYLIFLLTGAAKQTVLADIIDRNDAGPAAYVGHHALHTVEVFTDEAAAGQA
ncbi:MAG: 6-phosphogluconolactonase [Prevotella sp.]|nr:6-phosphogluconolactonase [Prevotella sp.]